MRAAYLDSSAIVKLVIAEPESHALRLHLRRRRPLVSSALARTEVLRAVLAEGGTAVRHARAVLDTVDLVRVSDRILEAAGLLRPPHLRPLDAIHLATAMDLQPDVGQLITYDERMIEAAGALSVRTASPA